MPQCGNHSFRFFQEFAGKRVLVVGSGESGSDICNEISKHAAATGLSIRGKHGHLIPRKQADGRVTDLNTNRCRYSNPYVLGDWVGYVNQLVSGRVKSVVEGKFNLLYYCCTYVYDKYLYPASLPLEECVE